MEAASVARSESRSLHSASLQYVHLMHLVRERKKFDFVESLLSFMHAWSNYHRHGSAVAADFDEYMLDLRSRVQRTRDNHAATVDQFEQLRDRTQVLLEIVDEANLTFLPDL